MADVCRSVLRESEDGQNESLDPRICLELEKLNKASDDINHLEVELDEARSIFRQVLTESTQQLNGLAKKLGTCIDKARPYYDARINAKEAQSRTQNAALRYERACSQLAAAKEMVNLAEQGYFKMGQPFDPAWQEMLNHSTMKVNDAERERLESEVEHQKTAMEFNDAEQLVKKLQKEWKRNIAKSRPYFETKAKVNQQMEEQKKRVAELERKVAEAKEIYAETLHSLERISDEIHQKRRDARRKRKRVMKQNSAGVIYHPLMHSSESSGEEEEEEIFIDLVPTNKSESVKNASVAESSDFTDPLNALKTGRRISSSGQPQQLNSPGKEYISSSAVDPHSRPNHNAGNSTDIVAADVQNDKNSRKDKPAVSLTTTPCSPRTPSGNSGESPDADLEQIRCNAEIMASICQSKSSRPYLRPNRSHDDFLCDGSSETESITSSFASAAMLDDEQIESLMLETTAYHDFLTKMDSSECDKFKRMSLPGKLSYLKNYVNFEPIWVDDEQDITSKSPSDPDDIDSAAGSGEDSGCADPVQVQCQLLGRSGADVDGMQVSETHYV